MVFLPSRKPLTADLARLFIGTLVMSVSCLLTSTPAAAKVTACVPHDARSLVERGRASTTPCVIGKRDAMLELGYYQNASTVGGTALAAYPLAHLRYGLTRRVELFLDPATAIAKSTSKRGGLYTWSRTGGGLRVMVADTTRNVLSANLEYTPQSDETASISTRERFDFGFRDRLAINPKFAVSIAAGNIVYAQTTPAGNQQSSLYSRLALSQKLSPRLTASGLLGRDAKITKDATPQTELGLTLQDGISPRSVVDFELGSALNPSGATKAHYIGFGISFLK